MSQCGAPTKQQHSDCEYCTCWMTETPATRRNHHEATTLSEHAATVEMLYQREGWRWVWCHHAPPWLRYSVIASTTFTCSECADAQ